MHVTELVADGKWP